MSSPFSGARRPTKIARGAARQSGRRCQVSVRNRDAVGNRHDSWFLRRSVELLLPRREDRIVPECQASRSSCSMDLEIATKAVARRQRRPIIRPKLPHDCHATSPVAPAPSGRSTTGKPNRLASADHAISVVLEHRDVRQVDRVLLKPASRGFACSARFPRTVAVRSPDAQPSADRTRLIPSTLAFVDGRDGHFLLRGSSFRPGIREVTTVTSAPSAARAAPDSSRLSRRLQSAADSAASPGPV